MAIPTMGIRTMAGIFGVIGLVIISECSCVFLAMNLIGQVLSTCTAYALHVLMHCMCTACALYMHGCTTLTLTPNPNLTLTLTRSSPHPR